MILVTGATGNVGRALVDLLAAAGETVRAVSRNPAKAALPAGVEVVAGDMLAPETLPPILKGVDKVFALFHLPGDPAQAVNFTKALAESEARKVVVFSSGSTFRVVPDDPIGDSHRRAEDVLRTLDREMVFLCPGTLMMNSLMWAERIRAGGDTVRAMRIAAAAVMDEADVARAAATVLTGTGPFADTYRLTGPEALSSGDQVAQLGEALGRPLKFEGIPDQEVAAMLGPQVGGTAAALAMLDAIASPDVPWAKPNGVFQELTGQAPSTYRQWIQRHLAAFRPA